MNTMKFEVHRSTERGESNLGWLHSRFSFSFANYYNPQRMGFGKLRVLNDDIVKGGKGFPHHPHENMEIISIITKGDLEHKDSMGTIEIVKAGEVQVMSAGSQVVHSEYNHSKTEPVEFFQIWIEPKKLDITPRHEKSAFNLHKNQLTLIVSGKEQQGTLTINQDANIYLGKFDARQDLEFKLHKGKGAYMFVIDGKIKVAGEVLGKRDAIGVLEASGIPIEVTGNSYLMVIEVPL